MLSTTADAVAELLRTVALVLREHTCIYDLEQEARTAGCAAGVANRVADALVTFKDNQVPVSHGEGLAGYVTRQQEVLTSYLARQAARS